VRLPLLYGDSAGRGLGASDSLLAAVDRDERPPLFTDEFRTPLEVQNAARALLELLDSGTRGILHVAGPQRLSRLELGLAVLDEMGLSPELARACITEARSADAPGPALRPRDVSLDARRARALLQTPLLSVREGLARALR
jgi:dTDP-4-dehydrorhamnose reductase